MQNWKEINRSRYIYFYGSHTKVDKYDRTAEQFDVGHTVAIKSALNLIPQNWINVFLSACEYIKLKIDDDWDTFKTMHMNTLLHHNNGLSELTKRIVLDKYDVIRKFMDLLNQRAKTNERLVYPFVIFEDLCISHIVLPSKCTDRIKQQQGAFIFPKYVNTDSRSMNYIKDEIDKSINMLSKELIIDDKKKVNVIKIPADKKLKIKQELSKLGITEGFVYPEIEHISNSFLNGY